MPLAMPGGRLADAEVGEHRGHAVELREQVAVLGGGHVLAGVHDRAVLERRDDRAEPLGPHAGPEHLERRRLDDALEHLALAAVVERLDLDLARRRRGERVEVGDARHDLALAVRSSARRAAFATSVS